MEGWEATNSCCFSGCWERWLLMCAALFALAGFLQGFYKGLPSCVSFKPYVCLLKSDYFYFPVYVLVVVKSFSHVDFYIEIVLKWGILCVGLRCWVCRLSLNNNKKVCVLVLSLSLKRRELSFQFSTCWYYQPAHYSMRRDGSLKFSLALHLVALALLRDVPCFWNGIKIILKYKG